MKTLEKITFPEDVEIVKYIEKRLVKNENSTTRESYLSFQFHNGQRVLLYNRNTRRQRNFLVSGTVINPSNCIFGDNLALCIKVDKKYCRYKSSERSYVYQIIEDAWEIK